MKVRITMFTSASISEILSRIPIVSRFTQIQLMLELSLELFKRHTLFFKMYGNNTFRWKKMATIDPEVKDYFRQIKPSS